MLDAWDFYFINFIIYSIYILFYLILFLVILTMPVGDNFKGFCFIILFLNFYKFYNFLIKMVAKVIDGGWSGRPYPSVDLYGRVPFSFSFFQNFRFEPGPCFYFTCTVRDARLFSKNFEPVWGKWSVFHWKMPFFSPSGVTSLRYSRTGQNARAEKCKIAHFFACKFNRPASTTFRPFLPRACN